MIDQVGIKEQSSLWKLRCYTLAWNIRYISLVHSISTSHNNYNIINVLNFNAVFVRSTIVRLSEIGQKTHLFRNT